MPVCAEGECVCVVESESLRMLNLKVCVESELL